MSERFQNIYNLENNLYVQNSPVILEHGSLLKDSVTSNLVVQLKFQSVTDATVIALKVSLIVYDITGKRIEVVDEYQYLDLCVKNGEHFGTNKAILLKNDYARSFKIDKISVVFENKDIYEVLGISLSALPYPKTLSSFFSNQELVKQYQIDSSSNGSYVPNECFELWSCTCGNYNSKDICVKCGAKKDSLFLAFNMEKLEENYSIRSEEEHNEILRREKEIIIEQQNRKKSTIISLILVSTIIIFFIIISCIDTYKMDKVTLANISRLYDFVGVKFDSSTTVHVDSKDDYDFLIGNISMCGYDGTVELQSSYKARSSNKIDVVKWTSNDEISLDEIAKVLTRIYGDKYVIVSVDESDKAFRWGCDGEFEYVFCWQNTDGTIVISLEN